MVFYAQLFAALAIIAAGAGFLVMLAAIGMAERDKRRSRRRYTLGGP